MKIARLLPYAALSLLVTPAIAQADENLWVYARSAETLPAGETEIVGSVVHRTGKADTDYAFNDIRLEVEHGITDRLSVYGEVILYDHDYSTTNPDLQPYFDTQGGAGGRFNDIQVAGFDVGLKYNILSPYSAPIGLAVGVGYDHRSRYRLDGAPINQNELEFTLFLQKNFLDNTLVFALSSRIELEHRTSPGIIEKEISIDVSAGVAYRVARGLSVGLEFRHQSDYLSPFDTVTGQYDPNLRPSDLDLFSLNFGSQYQYGNYVGPTVHYANQNWWVTAGILWQVSGGGRFAFNRNGLNVDEHERVHVGLSFGLEL